MNNPKREETMKIKTLLAVGLFGVLFSPIPFLLLLILI